MAETESASTNDSGDGRRRLLREPFRPFVVVDHEREIGWGVVWPCGGGVLVRWENLGAVDGWLETRFSGADMIATGTVVFLDTRRLVREAAAPKAEGAPIPMRLPCPMCGTLHIDEGEFATKAHHTHSCQECGLTWRPAVVPTVGVRFLPGFRNAEEPR